MHSGPPQLPRPPFMNRSTTLPWHQRALLVMLSPIALVRLVLLLLVLLASALVSSIALIGLSNAMRSDCQPLASWRQAFLRLLPLLMRCKLLVLGFFPWLGLRVRRASTSKSAAAAVVANHTTFIDPVVIMSLQRVLPVSAAENARDPLIGSIIQALRTLLIRRGDSSHRSQAAKQIAGAMADQSTPPVLIFPEGCASDGTALLRFRLGAFTPLLPVQPVTLRYTNALGLDFCWVSGGQSQFALLFWMLASPWSVAHVTYLPVMGPSDEEVQQALSARPSQQAAAATSFAARVAGTMASALGIPASTYAETDQHAVMRPFLDAGYPVDITLTKVIPPGGLSSLCLSISREALKQAVDDFIAADTTRRGVLQDGSTFATFLRQKASTTARPAPLREIQIDGTPTSAGHNGCIGVSNDVV